MSLRKIDAARMVVAGLAVLGVAGGCDAGSTAARPGSSAVSAATPSASPLSSRASATPAVVPSLPIKPSDRVLVEAMSSARDGKTPVFTFEQHLTVGIVCAGRGKVRVRWQEMDEVVPCDGLDRRLHMIAEETTASVRFTTSGRVRWTAAVLVTDNFRPVTPGTTSTPPGQVGIG